MNNRELRVAYQHRRKSDRTYAHARQVVRLVCDRLVALFPRFTIRQCGET